MAAFLRHEGPTLGIQVEFVVMRNVFVPDATRHASIGASPEPAPTVIRVGVFRVNREVYFSGAPEEAARNVKGQFALREGRLEGACRHSLAPAPAFPSADEKLDPIFSQFRRQEEVAFERQEHGRAFEALRKGEDGCSDRAARAEREAK